MRAVMRAGFTIMQTICKEKVVYEKLKKPSFWEHENEIITICNNLKSSLN
jgi:hypothetical protein